MMLEKQVGKVRLPLLLMFHLVLPGKKKPSNSSFLTRSKYNKRIIFPSYYQPYPREANGKIPGMERKKILFDKEDASRSWIFFHKI